MKIFCIANQKGGVGKTTTTVNLAAGLAKIGQRVLLVDLDPQGNATMGSGVDKRAMDLSVYDVLLESASVAEAAVVPDKLKEAGCAYAVLGANRELAGAEVELVGEERRERRLKDALAAVSADYDFVLIDCPPNLGIVTWNGLSLSDGYIIPTIPDILSTYGIPQIQTRVKAFAADADTTIAELGIVVSKYREASTVHRTTVERLEDDPDLPPVFETRIPEGNAYAAGVEFTKRSTLRQKYGYQGGYEVFRALAREVIDAVEEL